MSRRTALVFGVSQGEDPVCDIDQLNRCVYDGGGGRFCDDCVVHGYPFRLTFAFESYCPRLLFVPLAAYAQLARWFPPNSGWVSITINEASQSEWHLASHS